MTQANHASRPGAAPRQKVRCGGFTLIEVITVIVIIGILSAVLLTRKAERSGELSGRLAELRSQLRFVQLSAMKSGVPYIAMRFDGAKYWAEYSNSTNMTLPGENATGIIVSDKSMTMTPAFNLRFDSLGVPYDGTGAKLASPQIITITVGGGTGNCTVTPETGYVQ